MRKRAKAKVSGFVSDFRAFINKGNVVDMAVGVIVGSAFSNIVSSLVSDVLTPALSLLTGQVSFTNLKWVLKEAIYSTDGTIITEEIAVSYGQFLQNILDFLLVAFCVFLVIRTLAKLRNIEEQIGKELKEMLTGKEAADNHLSGNSPEPEKNKSTDDEKIADEIRLLQEIRDLLTLQTSTYSEQMPEKHSTPE